MKKRVLLMGGYHKAYALGDSLLKKGYEVTAINKNREECRTLAELKGLNVIWGDATRPYILEEACADEADIVIALTQKDEENLVMCELCKQKFHVKKTVALVNDPKKTEFFRKMGIDSAVCAINTITNIIEQQAVMEKMTQMTSIGEGKINILEVPIPPSSPVAGRKLWEINLPKDVIVGCIIRDEKSLVPSGDTVILHGDIMILIASGEQETKAVRLLTGRRAG